ncbi:hypothetical protein Q7C36_011238 [Tachysurus vachellii]|uniref:Uncharacterized protein n=1 Tax=Tachysurus vachellii TaxID=175792 RepID=A0AA88MTP4_TACVA|nr:hypothetical protein Q7C36_011238 [Tachysurus vachellii]
MKLRDEVNPEQENKEDTNTNESILSGISCGLLCFDIFPVESERESWEYDLYAGRRYPQVNMNVFSSKVKKRP